MQSDLICSNNSVVSSNNLSFMYKAINIIYHAAVNNKIDASKIYAHDIIEKNQQYLKAFLIFYKLSNIHSEEIPEGIIGKIYHNLGELISYKADTLRSSNIGRYTDRYTNLINLAEFYLQKALDLDATICPSSLEHIQNKKVRESLKTVTIEEVNIKEKIIELNIFSDNKKMLNIVLSNECSLLALTLKFNMKEAALALIKAGVNVNDYPKTWPSPLQNVLKKGGKKGLELVSTLIKAGADVNVKTCFNETPLITILSKSYKFSNPKTLDKIASEIITAGASLNDKDAYNRTPLTLAIANKRVDLAIDIIERGVDVNIGRVQGSCALELALEKPDNTKLIVRLINAGANVMAQNSSGQIMLKIILARNDYDYFDLLISRIKKGVIPTEIFDAYSVLTRMFSILNNLYKKIENKDNVTDYIYVTQKLWNGASADQKQLLLKDINYHVFKSYMGSLVNLKNLSNSCKYFKSFFSATNLKKQNHEIPPIFKLSADIIQNCILIYLEYMQDAQHKIAKFFMSAQFTDVIISNSNESDIQTFITIDTLNESVDIIEPIFENINEDFVQTSNSARLNPERPLANEFDDEIIRASFVCEDVDLNYPNMLESNEYLHTNASFDEAARQLNYSVQSNDELINTLSNHEIQTQNSSLVQNESLDVNLREESEEILDSLITEDTMPVSDFLNRNAYAIALQEIGSDTALYTEESTIVISNSTDHNEDTQNLEQLFQVNVNLEPISKDVAQNIESVINEGVSSSFEASSIRQNKDINTYMIAYEVAMSCNSDVQKSFYLLYKLSQVTDTPLEIREAALTAIIGLEDFYSKLLPPFLPCNRTLMRQVQELRGNLERPDTTQQDILNVISTKIKEVVDFVTSNISTGNSKPSTDIDKPTIVEISAESYTLLHLAAALEERELVSALINQGYSIEAKYYSKVRRKDITPLDIILRKLEPDRSGLEIIIDLVNNNIINHTLVINKFNQEKILHVAAKNKKIDLVLSLIEKGADLYAANKSGTRPADILKNFIKQNDIVEFERIEELTQALGLSANEYGEQI